MSWERNRFLKAFISNLKTKWTSIISCFRRKKPFTVNNVTQVIADYIYKKYQADEIRNIYSDPHSYDEGKRVIVEELKNFFVEDLGYVPLCTEDGDNMIFRSEADAMLFMMRFSG